MEQDQQKIDQFLNTLASEIKRRVPSASGKTAESLEVRTTPTSGTLLAAAYIMTLEHGRPPTRPNAPKGSPTLQQSIYAWIKFAGIGTTQKNQESLSWAISQKIHKEGNLLYRSGGHSGVLSNVITKSRIDAFVNSFGEQYQSKVSSDLLKEFTKPS